MSNSNRDSTSSMSSMTTERTMRSSKIADMDIEELVDTFGDNFFAIIQKLESMIQDAKNKNSNLTIDNVTSRSRSQSLSTHQSSSNDSNSTINSSFRQPSTISVNPSNQKTNQSTNGIPPPSAPPADQSTGQQPGTPSTGQQPGTPSTVPSTGQQPATPSTDPSVVPPVVPSTDGSNNPPVVQPDVPPVVQPDVPPVVPSVDPSNVPSTGHPNNGLNEQTADPSTVSPSDGSESSNNNNININPYIPEPLNNRLDEATKTLNEIYIKKPSVFSPSNQLKINKITVICNKLVTETNKMRVLNTGGNKTLNTIYTENLFSVMANNILHNINVSGLQRDANTNLLIVRTKPIDFTKIINMLSKINENDLDMLTDYLDKYSTDKNNENNENLTSIYRLATSLFFINNPYNLPPPLIQPKSNNVNITNSDDFNSITTDNSELINKLDDIQRSINNGIQYIDENLSIILKSHIEVNDDVMNIVEFNLMLKDTKPNKVLGDVVDKLKRVIKSASKQSADYKNIRDQISISEPYVAWGQQIVDDIHNMIEKLLNVISDSSISYSTSSSNLGNIGSSPNSSLDQNQSIGNIGDITQPQSDMSLPNSPYDENDLDENGNPKQSNIDDEYKAQEKKISDLINNINSNITKNDKNVIQSSINIIDETRSFLNNTNNDYDSIFLSIRDILNNTNNDVVTRGNNNENLNKLYIALLTIALHIVQCRKNNFDLEYCKPSNKIISGPLNTVDTHIKSINQDTSVENIAIIISECNDTLQKMIDTLAENIPLRLEKDNKMLIDTIETYKRNVDNDNNEKINSGTKTLIMLFFDIVENILKSFNKYNYDDEDISEKLVIIQKRIETLVDMINKCITPEEKPFVYCKFPTILNSLIDALKGVNDTINSPTKTVDTLNECDEELDNVIKFLDSNKKEMSSYKMPTEEFDDSRSSLSSNNDNTRITNTETFTMDDYNRDSLSSLQDVDLENRSSEQNKGMVPLVTINGVIDQLNTLTKYAENPTNTITYTYPGQKNPKILDPSKANPLREIVKKNNNIIIELLKLIKDKQLPPEKVTTIIDILSTLNEESVSNIINNNSFYYQVYEKIIVSLYNTLFSNLKNIPEIGSNVGVYSLEKPHLVSGGTKNIKRTYKNKRKTKRPNKSSRTRRTNSPRNKKYYY